MVITVILLRQLWCAWRKRENQHSELAQLSSRDLADIGLTDAERRGVLDAPLWQSAIEHYRDTSAKARARRARTQTAMSRLSRMQRRTA